MRLNIFVSSPSDVEDHRKALRACIEELNAPGGIADRHGVSLVWAGWETVPSEAGKPQAVILADRPPTSWDIFIGILWHRFGSPTGAVNPDTRAPYESGTEQEFREAYRQRQIATTDWPKVAFYHYSVPPKHLDAIDPDQLGRVQKFVQQCKPFGQHPLLYKQYERVEELVTIVSASISRWIPAWADRARLLAAPQAMAKSQPQDRPWTSYCKHILGRCDRGPVYVALEFHKRDCDKAKDSIGDLAHVVRYAEDHGLNVIVVLGASGAGKTTAIYHAAAAMCKSAIAPTACADERSRYPILVDLSRLRHIPGNLVDLLRLTTPRDVPDGTFSFQTLLSKEKCVVFLDGFDKLSDQGASRLILDALGRWRVEYPDHLFVLSSQFYAWRRMERVPYESYLEVSTADFKEQQIKDFIRQWITSLNGTDEVAERLARDMPSAIKESESLTRLAANPLMLRTILDVYCRRRTRPDNKVRLYSECVEMLLDQWDLEAGPDVGVDSDQARAILQAMAWWMQEHTRCVASQDEVLDAVGTRFHEVVDSSADEKKIRTALYSLREKSGLFEDCEGDCREGHYSLRHDGVRWLLAAEEVRNRGTLRILAQALNQREWRELILMTMGLLNPSVFTGFMHEIIESEAFLKNTKMILDCYHSARFRSLSPFEKILANGKSALGKYIAVLVLRENGSSEAKTLLGRAAKDRDIVVPGFRVADAATDALLLGTPQEANTPQMTRDGSILCPVAGGDYQYGVSERDIEALRTHDNVGYVRYARRVRATCVEKYYIGKYPVTNAQFKRFCNETDHSWTAPSGFERPNQPAVKVSWEDAVAYCVRYGLQLPTEVQWEKAARGTDGRLYPWGSTVPIERNGKSIAREHLANCRRDHAETSPVGCYPEGMSPYGCMDMAGNVWQWCSSEWQSERSLHDEERGVRRRRSERSERILRGGAWCSSEPAVCCAARLQRSSDTKENDAGFRVVYVPRETG